MAVVPCIVSCAEEYYYVKTDFTGNGKIGRTVYFTDSLQSVRFQEAGWDVDTAASLPGGEVDYKCVAMNSADGIGDLYPFFVHTGVEERMDKKFKWFVTEFRYSAVFPECDWLPVGMDGFMNEQERNIWLRGDGMEPVSGYELLYRLDDINDKFMNWYAYSFFEYDCNLFMEYMEKSQADSLVKYKEAVYSEIRDDFGSIMDELTPECFAGVADRYFGGNYYGGLYGANKAAMDERYESDVEKMNGYFKDYWYFTVDMPGRIVETDAKLHDSSSATWYIYPIRMLDAPLAIEAVSVKTNLWACIVTAIAIVGVGGLIALLCGVPARMSASRRAHVLR